MKKVLSRTLMLTLLSILLLGFSLHYIGHKTYYEEIILIILLLSLLAAIPVILGYVLSYYARQSPTSVLTFFSIILFIFNGLLIGGTALLTLMILLDDKVAISAIPFILSGSYTYYETGKEVLAPKQITKRPSSSHDILDDNLF